MATFELEPYFTPEHQGLYEIVALEGELYFFTPENTVIKRVEMGDGDYDHILHDVYNDRDTGSFKKILMFVDWIEESDPGLIDRLEDKGYIVQLEEKPDEHTIEIYSEWVAQDLDEGIPPNDFEDQS